MGTSATERPVVLIVEDEFLLRMNAAEMVGDAGFDVVEAGNAEEAIAILEVRPDIHVVFTDAGRQPLSAKALSPGPNRRDASRVDRCRVTASQRSYALIGECRRRDQGRVAAHGIDRSDPQMFAVQLQCPRASRRIWRCWRDLQKRSQVRRYVT
jgi:CheY-like chemotaxis protein